MSYKKILILGAGKFHLPIIQQLVDAGFFVLACDRDSLAPGAEFANVFRPIDISDADSVLAWARSEKIDGILPISEFGTRTAAKVANELGLPGISLDFVDCVNDKGLMRDSWKRSNLSQPDYSVVGDFETLAAAAALIGYPVVVKPTDSGGSGRGVSLAHSPDELQWSFDLAAPFVKNGRYIVEEFLDGVELTVETFTQPGGNTYILTMSDKVKAPLRTRVASSLNFPANISDEMADKVEKLVINAISSLGISLGMAHTELIVTKDGPFLVETGARGGGGHIFHTIIEAVSSFRAPLFAAMATCGMLIDMPKLKKRGAVYRFFTPPEGILSAVVNLAEARLIPGVLDIGLNKKVGDRINQLDNSLERVGYVVTSGETREDAIRLADRVNELVRFVVRCE
jgi:biotin carboxylase